jgi:hypothetical protein
MLVRQAREGTMKKAILIKTDAALAIGAVFPLGAIAAQPAKAMTERGVIEKKERFRIGCFWGEA